MLLQSTETVQDVVAVERELGRVQAELDALEARLEHLATRVAMGKLFVLR